MCSIAPNGDPLLVDTHNHRVRRINGWYRPCLLLNDKYPSALFWSIYRPRVQEAETSCRDFPSGFPFPDKSMAELQREVVSQRDPFTNFAKVFCTWPLAKP